MLVMRTYSSCTMQMCVTVYSHVVRNAGVLFCFPVSHVCIADDEELS